MLAAAGMSFTATREHPSGGGLSGGDRVTGQASCRGGGGGRRRCWEAGPWASSVLCDQACGFPAGNAPTLGTSRLAPLAAAQTHGPGPGPTGSPARPGCHRSFCTPGPVHLPLTSDTGDAGRGWHQHPACSPPSWPPGPRSPRVLLSPRKTAGAPRPAGPLSLPAPPNGTVRGPALALAPAPAGPRPARP